MCILACSTTIAAIDSPTIGNAGHAIKCVLLVDYSISPAEMESRNWVLVDSVVIEWAVGGQLVPQKVELLLDGSSRMEAMIGSYGCCHQRSARLEIPGQLAALVAVGAGAVRKNLPRIRVQHRLAPFHR